MKTEHGVIRGIDYQTGEIEIQLDSGLWIETTLNPADVQDIMSDDVVSVALNKNGNVRYIEPMEV